MIQNEREIRHGHVLRAVMMTAARPDIRVMFGAGLAPQELGWLGDCKSVMAIPVSASSKNPFDRKTKESNAIK